MIFILCKKNHFQNPDFLYNFFIEPRSHITIEIGTIQNFTIVLVLKNKKLSFNSFKIFRETMD